MICDTQILLQFATDLPIEGQGLNLWPNELLNKPGDIDSLMSKSQHKLDMNKFDKMVWEPYYLALEQKFLSDHLND